MFFKYFRKEKLKELASDELSDELAMADLDTVPCDKLSDKGDFFLEHKVCLSYWFYVRKHYSRTVLCEVKYLNRMTFFGNAVFQVSSFFGIMWYHISLFYSNTLFCKGSQMSVHIWKDHIVYIVSSNEFQNSVIFLSVSFVSFVFQPLL